jgi:hypothetical protein
MKTRFFSSAVVVLCILLVSSMLQAQIARVSLYGYFGKLPQSPKFPLPSALASTSPMKFEDCADLNAMRTKLESSLKIISYPEEGKPKVIDFASEKPEVRRQHDEVLSALDTMQAIRTEYQAKFRTIDDASSRHSSKDIPELVRATHGKIENEEQILSGYLARIKPVFKIVDDLLVRYQYGAQAQSAKTKNIFRGAQQCQALILTDIIERLKLERITISNCARLAQQTK